MFSLKYSKTSIIRPLLGLMESGLNSDVAFLQNWHIELNYKTGL